MIHTRTLQSLEFDKISDRLAKLCFSAPGRRLAASLAPMDNRKSAEKSLSLYEQSSIWLNTDSGKRLNLSGCPDAMGLMQTLKDRRRQGEGALPAAFRLDLDAFWALREILRLGKAAHDSITTESHAHLWPDLLNLAEASPLPVQLLAALDRCISDDGLLKDESSPELFRLRAEIRRIHQGCLRKVKEFANQYNILPWLQDEFITLSSDRYVLPLKSNFKGRLQGIIHDWSQTGETCYFEPIFLVEINNRLRELKHEEREEEQNILAYLTGLLDAEFDGVLAVENLLAQLDFLQAKNRLAESLDARTVSFTSDKDGIELIHATHPLLMLARQEQKDKNDILQPARPLDIILRPGERALIITGGNAGGKTVCLKTLGLLAAMAMSGLPIPAAKGSHLPWFDRMDAFIGDEQSLDNNVSTFTAQIEHLGKAWKYLDASGLVLLDEFGAGTDPAEGAALAQAVHDQLLDKQCFVLSATHFPALKSYALARKGARAASMLFNPETGRPLFRLAYDQVGSSQALEVAAKHGMPEEVLTRARHYLLQDGQDSSAILQKLNDLAASRESELADIRAQKKKDEAILAEKKSQLDRERARLHEEIRGKISQLMREVKEGKSTAKQTLKEMSGLRAELGLPDVPVDNSVLPQAANFSIGQTAFHTVFNKRGKITDLDDRRKRIRLEMDGVSLWADMKDVRQTSDIGAQTSSGRKISVRTQDRPSGLVLDVRGKRANEALAEVERFLDRAIPDGFGEVEIVHGRGTGALRREIHDFLRNFPGVESLRLAPEDRGGDGMTIVTLK